MPYDTTLDQTIRTTGVLRCLECGKCTAICPVARRDGGFSPRLTIERAITQQDEELFQDDRLWSCLTCLQCSQVCPANVDYAALTAAVRAEARRRGEAPLYTHGEAIHVWMRMMTEPTLKQNRLDWLSTGSEDLSTSTTSDTLYFAGCAPLYDALFAPLGVAGTPVAQASIRIMNALGIQPQVLADERCCGHDLLWEGDSDRFMQLAQLNAEMIRAAGVKHIVSSCPECVRALKIDYPAHGVELHAQVLHLSELLGDLAFDRRRPTADRQSPALNLQSLISNLHTVTFHDPCRLGRHLGVYDAPRRVLEKLGYQIMEMPHNRRNATCCGTNGWTHCGAANRAIQLQRLREAKATGAELVVTACTKCQIHFQCALQDKQVRSEVGIPMVDLATLVAARL